MNSVPSGAVGDANSPYSFKEWSLRRPEVDEKHASALYERYVVTWFNDRRLSTKSDDFILRQKYLYLLKQLELFFTDEEKNNWYSKINFADEKQLLIAIPEFARKLKEISLYYLDLRKKVKKSKTKYNTVGTSGGLEHEIYSQILNMFSDETEKFFWDSKVENSITVDDIKNNLLVKIEELYDDKIYHDRSPTLAVSSYYNPLHTATEAFFATKGIVLSSSEWMFNALDVIPETDVDSFVSKLTANIFEKTETEDYLNFVQKYIAEDKFFTTTQTTSSITKLFDTTILQGNNKFYYPFGSSENIYPSDSIIAEVALSSLDIAGSTAGATLSQADTMFVTIGNQTQGAWLKFIEFEESDKVVDTALSKNSKTSFIYPYPGWGLSGQNTNWTGPSFKSQQEYKFLKKNFKTAIEQAYWMQSVDDIDTDLLLLTNSNLANNGALPANNPNLADNIFISELTQNKDTLFGEISGAWLYKFDSTSIPILPADSNRILWPYAVLDPELPIETHYKNLDFTDVCDPIAIKDLKLPFANAGSSFENADKIYKLAKINDPLESATECAWLSGYTETTEKYSFVNQDSFSCIFESGKYTRFVWNGPDANADDVFSSVKHDSDCPFNTGKATIAEPSKCTCKQVYYSPYGHPGATFTANNQFTDCIFEDTENALELFDLGSRGIENQNAIASFARTTRFAWYKTKLEKGWGDGRWVAGNVPTSTPFVLKKGKAYFYRRISSKLFDEPFPPYVVFYKHALTIPTRKWVEAKLVNGDVWQSTNKPSSITIFPGDILKYDRPLTTKAQLLSSGFTEVLARNTGNVWASIDVIPIKQQNLSAEGDFDYNSVTITFPSNKPAFTKYGNQYPQTSFAHVSAVKYWDVDLMNSDGTTVARTERIAINSPILTFAPLLSGVYRVRVTVVMRTGVVFSYGEGATEGTVTAVKIPRLTALPQFSRVTIPVDFEIPAAGMLLEQKLTGWSYNKNRPVINAAGAKPYWAPLITNKDISTIHKGAISWGYEKFYAGGYLPTNIPKVSPLVIKAGSVITYNRRGKDIRWKQPTKFYKRVNKTQWCVLSSYVELSSNLLKYFDIKDKPELRVYALDIPSPIVLSNQVRGYPPLVHYYALNSFVWSMSSEVIVYPKQNTEKVYESKASWANSKNRFYPTVASIPVLEEVYSASEVGGYFLPQNLGASQLVNTDFTPVLKGDNEGGELTEDVNIHIGGLGLTKQPQKTSYTWKENNNWMFEPSTAGDLAGAPRKSLTKQLQTFIPYNSNIGEESLGIITNKSKLTPWGGLEDSEWKDKINEPKSYTGVRNLSAWYDKQLFKFVNRTMECWTGDIYGNQYGLFKANGNYSLVDRREASGQLWVRDSYEQVYPAYIGLSSIFDPFSGSSFYSELTGDGIKFVDCFYNTIMIETSGVVLYADVDVDRNSKQITSTFDNTRAVYLTAGKIKYENSWFFAKPKRLISLYTEISGTRFTPKLWELNISNRNSDFVFPSDEEKLEIYTSLSSLSVQQLQRGCISYDDTTRLYLLTYTGKTTSQRTFVVNFKIKNVLDNFSAPELVEIELFRDLIFENQTKLPPIVSNEFLTTVELTANNNFSISVSALNSPSYFTLINYSNRIKVTNQGTFTGILSAGLYHVNYVVGNEVGETRYCLTLLSK